MLQNQHIAFIGGGVMGEAMLKGLLAKQLISAEKIIVSDPHQTRGDQLVNLYGIRFTTDNTIAVQNADIVVLSVKPQVMGDILQELKGRLKPSAVVISIAAGVKLKAIQQGSDTQFVARAMPNTPGQIGEGMTVWTCTPDVTEDTRLRIETILEALGATLYVHQERFMDMATALNGSGPSYVFLLMEAMIDAGVHMGFSRQDAQMLVHQTMLGSVKYAIQSGNHPAELRNQVTSPGGTSAAALYQLEKGSVRTIISKAIWAAYNRSVELGQDD
jgi:pyrroline-5-carboxylate reductase